MLLSFPSEQQLIYFFFLCHPFNALFFDLSPSGYTCSMSFSLIFISFLYCIWLSQLHLLHLFFAILHLKVATPLQCFIRQLSAPAFISFFAGEGTWLSGQHLSHVSFDPSLFNRQSVQCCFVVCSFFSLRCLSFLCNLIIFTDICDI